MSSNEVIPLFGAANTITTSHNKSEHTIQHDSTVGCLLVASFCPTDSCVGTENTTTSGKFTKLLRAMVLDLHSGLQLRRRMASSGAVVAAALSLGERVTYRN
jgi:hypothetical protein